ncbi:MAG: sigma-54 dependent transcriptional regulator [candidate division WOR-3 bacterium]
MKPLVLVVDDDIGLAEQLGKTLRSEGYDVVLCHQGGDGLSRIAEQDFNLVLLDLMLPDMSGLDVLKKIKELKPDLPVVMVSSFGTIPVAVEATRLGVYDFLEKPFEPDRLFLVVRNALEQDRLAREVESLRRETRGRYEMFGSSAAIQKVFRLIEQAAPSQTTILVLGETGVGKELVARAIHEQSPRARHRFVKVNSAAIPQELIESELFGYEKGAFSGAVARKPGKLELAHEGTLFLDEVGDLSLYTQAKLLRFLQDREFERVGGTETLRIDVRVIAATNKNLVEEIKNKNFREDLYYRLNEITIRVPPLRERKEDIPLLCQHFLERFCEEEGVPMKTLTPDAIAFLSSQEWPGNVRELRGVMRRLVVLSHAPVVSARDIALLATGNGNGQTAGAPQSFYEARDRFERDYILKVIAEEKGNMSSVARVLDMDRSTLYRNMERLGIKPPQS